MRRRRRQLKWAFANPDPGWAWHDTGVVLQSGLSAKEKVTVVSSRLRSSAPLPPGVHGEEVEGLDQAGDRRLPDEDHDPDKPRSS